MSALCKYTPVRENNSFINLHRVLPMNILLLITEIYMLVNSKIVKRERLNPQYCYCGGNMCVYIYIL